MTDPIVKEGQTAEVAEFLNSLQYGQFLPMDHVRAFAIYGSLIYKPLAEVRDIDMFAITSGRGETTGRIEVLIPIKQVGFKRASIYLIGEHDYLWDAIYGHSGGRWPALGYHGYISVKRKSYDEYHAWGLAGLSYHLDLPLELAPVDFFQASIIRICSVYPMYAKSVIDYLEKPRMRKIAADVHCRTRSRAISNLDAVKLKANRIPRRQMKKRYLSMELGARPPEGDASIRPLRDKLTWTLSKIWEHESDLSAYCGKNGFAAMVESYEEAFEILEELEEAAGEFTECVCPLIGRYEIDCS